MAQRIRPGERIEALALQDATVQQGMAYYRNSTMSYVKALEFMVLAMNMTINGLCQQINRGDPVIGGPHE